MQKGVTERKSLSQYTEERPTTKAEPILSNVQVIFAHNAIRMVNFRGKRIVQSRCKTQNQIVANRNRKLPLDSAVQGDHWSDSLYVSDLDSEHVLPHIYNAPVVTLVVSIRTRNLECLQRL